MAEHRTDARIHQHLLEHAARTDHQQNNACRLQRAAADFHHLLFFHALTSGQAINRHQTGEQNGNKRMPDKLQPLIQLRAFWGKARADGFQTNQHQREKDQRDAEAKRRQLAFMHIGLMIFRR